jgi:hypothetical protein
MPPAQPDGTVAEGFEGVGELFPPGLFDNGRPGRGDMAVGWEELSGKFAFVARLLAVLRSSGDDKCAVGHELPPQLHTTHTHTLSLSLSFLPSGLCALLLHFLCSVTISTPGQRQSMRGTVCCNALAYRPHTGEPCPT